LRARHPFAWCFLAGPIRKLVRGHDLEGRLQPPAERSEARLRPQRRPPHLTVRGADTPDMHMAPPLGVGLVPEGAADSR
jgi:hypothetical protein